MKNLVGTVLAVSTMLFFGSLNTILLKVELTLTSVGVNGQLKYFKKPWFMTLTMFASMFLSLGFVAVKQARQRSKSALNESLMDKSDSQNVEKAEQKSGLSYAAKVRLVAIPAICDLLGIGIALCGLLLVPASIWQILRGAELVFAEIISVLLLNHESFAYKWLSVAVCVLGIAAVGTGSVLGSQDQAANDSNAEPARMVAIGIGMVLFSQIIQAGQMVGEEYLMSEVDLEPMEVIGYEGMWGMLSMVVLVLPLVYYLPGADSGSQENTIDSFVMLENSGRLFMAWFLLFLSCLIYNLSGIMITSYLSAVHRVIIEAMRTLVVWVIALIVHYYVDKQSGFGEALTPYSWLQALGFLIVLLGQLLYGALIKVPGLKYPPPEMASAPSSFQSPSAMRSPLAALAAGPAKVAIADDMTHPDDL